MDVACFRAQAGLSSGGSGALVFLCWAHETDPMQYTSRAFLPARRGNKEKDTAKLAMSTAPQARGRERVSVSWGFQDPIISKYEEGFRV